MGDRLWTGIPSRYVTSQLGQLSLASPGVAKSSTSFGWGKGGNVASAGWQVTPCEFVVIPYGTRVPVAVRLYLLTIILRLPLPLPYMQYIKVKNQLVQRTE